MNFKLLNPSRYLQATDFEHPDWKLGKEPTLTITKVVLEQMDGENNAKETKGMLFLAEQPKGWVMNVTNAKCLAAMFGDETNNWIGKRVSLHQERVLAFGEMVPGIRIHGSPDIASNVAVTLKLKKKKTTVINLVKTGSSSPRVFGPTGTVDFGPKKGTPVEKLTDEELAAAITLGSDQLKKAPANATWVPKTKANVDELLAVQALRAMALGETPEADIPF